MRFDQVDGHAAAAGRKSHAKLEQGVDIAGFGIGDAAPDQEFRPLLTNGTHDLLPISLLPPVSAGAFKQMVNAAITARRKCPFPQGNCRSGGGGRWLPRQSAASGSPLF